MFWNFEVSPRVHQRTLSRYNSSSSRILSVVPQIATSVAARGLDVKQLILVVNYDCPNHYEDYVHRCGWVRTYFIKGELLSVPLLLMQQATEVGNWIYGFFFLALFVLLLERSKRGGKIATCGSFFLPVLFAFSVNGEWEKCFTFTSKIYFGPAPGKRSLKWNTAVLQQVVLERPSNLNSRQSQREELILCQILFIFVLEFVFTTAVLKDV